MNAETRQAALLGSNGPEHCQREVLYRSHLSMSSGNHRLEQAAEVLCLLAFFPLSATGRTHFWDLFEQRMRRAYEVDHG